jgi:hypothetical protein
MSIDNPWPDRQDAADDADARQARQVDAWRKANFWRAVEIAAQIEDLENELEALHDCSFNEYFEEFFNVKRSDIEQFRKARS